MEINVETPTAKCALWKGIYWFFSHWTQTSRL